MGGKSITLRPNGTLRQHLKPNRNMRYRKPECPGSGQPPATKEAQ